MDKEEVLVMFTMVIIIGVGVIYTVITDYQSSFKNNFMGIGILCKDLIPLASIVFGYYLGKSK